jgi:hypothetical protein
MKLTDLIPYLEAHRNYNVVPDPQGVMGREVYHAIFHLPNKLDDEWVARLARLLLDKRNNLGVSGVVCGIGHRHRAAYLHIPTAILYYTQAKVNNTPPAALYLDPTDALAMATIPNPGHSSVLVVDQYNRLEVRTWTGTSVWSPSNPLLVRVQKSKLPVWWDTFKLELLFNYKSTHSTV